MTNQTTSEYMLFHRHNEWYKRASAEEIQKVMAQTKAWFEGLLARGVVKGHMALEHRTAVVSRKGGQVVTDGPYAEVKEAIGGYVQVAVGSFEEAIAIARACPVIAYGPIEVRPVAADCPMAAAACKSAEKGEPAMVAA